MIQPTTVVRVAHALRLDFGKRALDEARERAQLFLLARMPHGHLLWTEVERQLSEDNPPIPADSVAA